jgi:hypothetical protein
VRVFWRVSWRKSACLMLRCGGDNIFHALCGRDEVQVSSAESSGGTLGGRYAQLSKNSSTAELPEDTSLPYPLTST